MIVDIPDQILSAGDLELAAFRVLQNWPFLCACLVFHMGFAVQTSNFDFDSFDHFACRLAINLPDDAADIVKTISHVHL